jgi:hypothetical protein
MRTGLFTGLAALIAAGLLSGCGVARNLGPGANQTNADVAQVLSAIANDPTVVADGLFDSPAHTGTTSAIRAPGRYAATALINPLSYWRTITTVQQKFEFAFSDTDSTGHPTQALVTIHKYLGGTFNIEAGDSPPGGTGDNAPVTVIHKRLADDWVRRLMLRRSEQTPGGDVREWEVVSVSGVEVTSTVPDVLAPARILSVKFQTASWQTTLTDPLALTPRHGLPSFDAGTSVAVTVTTKRADDVVVLMHRDGRVKLSSNGDGTYTGTWTPVPGVIAVQHVGVNAFSRGTLFDDAAPYDSHAWLWPHVVGGVGAANQ